MNKPVPNSIAALADEMTAWRRDFQAEAGQDEGRR